MIPARRRKRLLGVVKPGAASHDSEVVGLQSVALDGERGCHPTLGSLLLLVPATDQEEDEEAQDDEDEHGPSYHTGQQAR